MSAATAKLEIGEAILKSLFQGLGPSGFAIALSNANCHGKAFGLLATVRHWSLVMIYCLTNGIKL
ncbi:MAG: hypothetical protein ACRC6V_01785 [Bacteroidales bacterium]